jgi:hypothetical protein
MKNKNLNLTDDNLSITDNSLNLPVSKSIFYDKLIGKDSKFDLRNHNKLKRIRQRSLRLFSIMIFLFIFSSAKEVQARTYDVTMKQYHTDKDFRYSSEEDAGYYISEMYPNEYQLDYKKFMKYTYKISDDSVVGLKANTDPTAVAIWLPSSYGLLSVMPYNINMYALGPGKATISVYDGKKLIDTFNVTVTVDKAISPSSYIDLTDDNLYDTISYTESKTKSIKEEELKKENDLIKSFAKAAADPKYTTTNQRILAALNAVINHGATQISEKKYKELVYNSWKKGTTLRGKYRTANSMLLEKKAVSKGFALVNRAVLSNLGFICSKYTIDESTKYYGCETWNYVTLFKKSDEEYEDENTSGYIDEVGFGAAAKLDSKYDFTSEDPESLYKKTHLPAWLIDKDTKTQYVSAGETKQLSTGDINDNIYSSDTSIVTVQKGSITGVQPGVAIVYRYNEDYCDVFYVVVKKKGTPITIQSKIYTKSTKAYFKPTAYAPYIRGGQSEAVQREDWLGLRIFDMEPIFGKGATLTTKYSEGIIECYLNENGESQLLNSTGSSGN